MIVTYIVDLGDGNGEVPRGYRAVVVEHLKDTGKLHVQFLDFDPKDDDAFADIEIEGENDEWCWPDDFDGELADVSAAVEVLEAAAAASSASSAAAKTAKGSAPPGWTREKFTYQSGAKYYSFRGPNGERAASSPKAWAKYRAAEAARAAGAAASSSSVGSSSSAPKPAGGKKVKWTPSRTPTSCGFTPRSR